MQIESSYPLAPLQHGMLIYSLSAPRSGIYVQQCLCSLREELDCAALKLAWQEVAERHAVLRTSFSLVNGGRPLQEVYGDVPIPWEENDWRGKPLREQSLGLEDFLNADRARGFELHRAPLMRLTLFRMGIADFRLIWTYHHALLDGRSRLLVLRELFTRYELIRVGRERPETSVRRYREFVDWLESQDWNNAKDFWKKRLNGCNPSTSFGLDQCRHANAGESNFGRQAASLNVGLTAALKRLSQQHEFTLNNLLQGTWALILSRYSGDHDVVFGATRSGRHATVPGADSMVGLLINTVPVRVRLSPREYLLPWLKEIKDQWFGIRPYEHTPLVDIQRCAELAPGTPLFESLVIFENYELNAALRAQGRQWETRDFHDLGATNYPITVTAYLDWQLLIKITYDRSRFDHRSISRMLGHLQALLQGMAANPTQRLSDLPILAEAEKHQLLVEWNDTEREYPKNKCIHELFEEQAKRTPEAVAVVFEDQQLTYRELNRRANRLAHRLRGLGVGPDVLVGLCVERSIELVIGILGILKAGGAYVPFDPSYPKDRLEFMLKDSDVSVLLTQKHLSANLSSHESPVVYLDGEHLKASADDTLKEANLESGAKPDNLAYVIYTSGSTGKPKGTLITHYNVVRLFQSTKEWFDFNSSDVWTLFHSYAFDFSVWEIWGALLNGGRLVVVPDSVSRSPEEFAALTKEKGVTVLNQTPSAFRQLIPHLISIAAAERSALRYVIFGGEALELQSLQPWLDRYGDETPKLINMYGITETTVHVTYRPITQADIKSGLGSVIGRSIPDLTVYVLDSHQQLQPIGIPGEIYVGGAGVARGYLQRPELTAQRFVTDPFSNDPRARLYRSGDLARRLPNGELEYLGRIDDQVKIRGFRIELGEIEAALNQHVQVREAVVIAREDTPGDKRLVAYFAADDGLAIEELRSRLSAALPNYMVPSAFVRLDSLPLTSNGKIDRAALPSPDQSRPELGQCYVGPRTEIEATLCEIFGTVLRVDKVGIHDNFFDLGGHSLLATQVIARIRSALDVEIPLRRLFEGPTIHGLARYIWEARQTLQAPRRPPICPAIRDGDPPLSFAQQRLWFIDQLEPQSSAYNVPGAWRLTGPLDIAALQRSINEIVRRHEALRTTFATVEGEAVQTIIPSLKIELPIIDLTSAIENEREGEAQRIVSEEAKRPFDLIHGPLVRAKLLRLGEEVHVLILNLHHIVSDGWSLGVLYRELSMLYQAFTNGQPSPLGDLVLQYADYAVWQRKWLTGEVLDRQLSYWKQQLEGIPDVHNLPTDRPRPPMQTYRGASESVVLSKKLTDKLRALGRKEGATLFMTLLTAFQILLHRYSGQDEIIVGSPIAGRNRREIEELIGFFVNTLVLRTNLVNTPTFTELLTRVRETALGAYAHQDLPFEKLVEALEPERDLSQAPLFQVMFVLQNAVGSAARIEGLSVTPFSIGGEIAKFDLTLSMHEVPGGMRGVLNYNTDLFNADTIKRMLRHFQILLQGILANPEQRISELPILSEAEKHQLLVEWNDTKRDYPKDKCIHQLFEEQVERTPDAVAVVFEDQKVTYRELNASANQLAHYLQKLGVGPEVLVGICVERSIEMVVGLLGILKAGGAYLPLDPGYPKDRIAYILKDTQASILLTEKRLLEDLGFKCIESSADRAGRSDSRFSVLDSHLTAICLDRDWKEISRESRETLQNQATPANLAYVIYTSGSTGLPKGVMIEQRNAVAFLSWAHSVFTQEELAGVIASTSICFDLSIFELFAPLTSGGRVILMENALALSDLDPALEPTLINTVPSAMIEVLRLTDFPASIRTVNLAGEPLKTSLVQEIYERTSARRVYDLYGPSETTTYSTYGLRAADGLQTIGRPIGNTQVYILDPHLNPVPIGVSGELYIGGPGVARGYFNRPELTAEKFIANPFSADITSRLYKTGDLARYLPDGNIEFLGRTDNQVKIRGYRIELGEIEAVLSQDPWIQDAIVIARGDVTGDRQVVAYVVPKRQTGNSPEDPSWAELQEKKVSEWQTLFDQIFAEADEPKDPTTNTAGVNSSYTNSPIPAAESRDWVEHAAKRILSLNPNRVLDIGCGLGRTLFRIAPYCSRYWGADFSQAALDYVEQHLDLLGNKRAEIKLIQANADDLSEISAHHFDTVVINGVTQYFPHIEHLVKVLEGALNAVEPGGVIFVGDVRSLPLLEPFQLSVELFRASDDVPAELLWQTVKRNVAQEEELVVDPVFFSAICRRLTKIDRADVLLKRGWAENELTRFRYDVILYVKPQEQPRLATAWLDWSKENLTLSSVRELLKNGQPRTLGIARVPNARVLPEYRAAASLACGGRTETARALRDAIETMRAEAFHPETFWALQNDLPYWVDITWSNTGGPECFDVFLQRRDLAVVRRPPASFQKEQVTLKSWHLYAHNPIEAKRNRLLGWFLRSRLKEKLPDYMIPSAFVVLDALPLTPNGKIDRKALPAPAQSRPELDETFSAPRTPVEELLVNIWANVLKLDKVGIHDNFFELGGHSLLATQVVSRVRQAFQMELPLRTLFEKQTVDELAKAITETQGESVAAGPIADILIELESLSDEEAQRLVAKETGIQG